MRTQTVLFVSAGLLQPKKRDHPLARRQLYLNYGALTLATQLNRSGIAAALVHGGHTAPGDFLDGLYEAGRLPSAYPVMLSMPSFYALGWAQTFCRLLRQKDAKARIVVGGRWVTGPDPDWLHGLIPEADAIVPGLGEGVIGGLVGALDASKAPTSPDLPGFGLDHTLVEGFEAFQPSIETSRGCGMGCAFCEERDIRLSSLRSPAQLAQLLVDTHAQYGGGEIHPYLQSSFFLPNSRWASQLREAVAVQETAIEWRCETRVDAMKPDTVEHLAAAGMKVIDLGLESASPQQILAMSKAKDPDRYLRSASDLLDACRRAGVWVKVNVLLYAGETEHTLGETQAWLDNHAAAIKGVSVGPVVVFGPPSTTAEFVEDLSSAGARIVDPTSAALSGLTHIHPSPTIDATEAEAISLNLSRRYMDEDAYFDLKAFSYYPRGYGRDEFARDLSSGSRDRLPFRSVAPR